MTTDAFDLEIPLAIRRRLESVDAELRTEPSAPVGAPRPIDLHLVPGRVELRSRRRPVVRTSGARPAFLAASVLLALAATVVVVTPGVRVGGSPPPGGSAPVVTAPAVTPSPAPSIAPSGSASASGSPTPSGAPSGPLPVVPAPVLPVRVVPVRVVREDAPALKVLARELRSDCIDKGVEPEPTPKASFVQAAASRATGEGWLDAAQTVWLGMDPLAAASAFESVVLIIGADGQWIIPTDDASSARRLMTLKTSGGIAYWLGTRVSGISCG